MCVVILIFLVYRQVEEYYSQLDPQLERIRQKLILLHPEAVNLDLYEGEKSYSINKEKIYLCLKDSNNKNYSDEIIFQVGVHELAHCINKKDVGHTVEFHRIFQQLLKKAELMGLHDPNIPVPQDYCEY
jgi:hypothetical protein